MRSVDSRRKNILLLVLAFVFQTLTVAHVSASVILPLDVEFSGATAPEGTAPWLTATFEDLGPSMVRLTMSADQLTGSEFVSTWLFNLDPALDGSLSFTPFDASSVSFVRALYNPDTYRVAGNRFDISFGFTRAKSGRFTAGESVIYDIAYSGSGTFNALSFNFGNSPDGAYQTAAHVQGIGLYGAYSGWIGNTTVIPEPATTALLGIGGAGVFGIRRIRRKGWIGFFDVPVFWRPFVFAWSASQIAVEPSHPVSDFLWKWYFRMERAAIHAAVKSTDMLLALLIPDVFVRCACPDCHSLNIRLSHHRSRSRLLRLFRLHNYVCKECRRRFVSGA